MPKIVVTQEMDLLPDQLERLRSLGDVTFYKDLAKTYDEWLQRVQDFDIICTGKYGLKQRIQDLRNVFISLPFVGVGWIDKDMMKANGVTASNAPGCNKDAVSEWVIGMIINLIRELPDYINVKTLPRGIPRRDKGLSRLNVTILGAGNIGTQVGKVCEALNMKVVYFRRDDKLPDTVKNTDVIINCLSLNPQTNGLLNQEFFGSLKRGSYFVSITDSLIFKQEALFRALDDGILAGAAIDCGSIQVADSDSPDYKTMRKHPKVLATPHIAYNTDVTARVANDMMIDNITAWLKGTPINVI